MLEALTNGGRAAALGGACRGGCCATKFQSCQRLCKDASTAPQRFLLRELRTILPLCQSKMQRNRAGGRRGLGPFPMGRAAVHTFRSGTA